MSWHDAYEESGEKYLRSTKRELGMDPDELIRVPRRLIRKLSSNELIMLCYLLELHWATSITRIKKYEGWFFCRMSKMQADLGMSPKCQQYVLSKLIRKRIIQRKCVGNPLKRFLKINGLEVKKLMQKRAGVP